MKNYNNAYMAELTEQELVENNGGIWPLIVKGLEILAVAVATDLILSGGETADAFMEGYRNGRAK